MQSLESLPDHAQDVVEGLAFKNLMLVNRNALGSSHSFRRIPFVRARVVDAIALVSAKVPLPVVTMADLVVFDV